MSSEKLGVLAAVARIAGHSLAEKVGRPKPTDPRAVPAGPDALTTGWLTGVLCADTPGAAVTGFALQGGSDGTTSRRQISVTYNAAGQDAGLPTDIFSKSTPSFTSRVTAGLSGALICENEFYRNLRSSMDVEAPLAYHSCYDAASMRSMLLLENVTLTKGAEFGDPTTLVVTRERAESMIDQMAGYHAAFWGDTSLEKHTWLPTALDFQLRINAVISFEKRSLIGVDRAADVIPSNVLARRDRIWWSVMASLELNSRQTPTLLHSDVHLGNWYVTGDGRMGQHDWQCMSRGQWSLDVAYALLSGLQIDDRRAWERDLLSRYLERLRENGVTPDRGLPSADAAFTAYRQQMWHAFVFWIYTIGAGRLQPQMQPEHISRENIRRMAAAIDDHDAFAAVRSAV
jgi:hypothetical protein